MEVLRKRPYALSTAVLLVWAFSVWCVPSLLFAQTETVTGEFGFATPAATSATTDAVAADPVVAAVTDDQRPPTSYRIETLNTPDVPGDFVVGPGKIELEIEPGQGQEVLLSVSNRMGVPRLFTLSVEDATGSDDPEQPIVLLGDDVGPYSLRDFVFIEDQEFIIEHNQRVTIPVRVSLPADAEPGGRYGSVLVSTASTESDAANPGAPRSTIISRIGSLFFVTTPGDIERAGQLVEFSTVPAQRLYTDGNLRFGILYENTGSVHVNPYGIISITNLLGAEVGRVEIDPWFSMPNSLRLREVDWDREALFGRYTATLELNRGYDDIIDTATYTFWVINWLWLGGGFAVLFLVFFLIRFVTSRFELKRKE